jgi:hypothetical protein
MVCEIPVGASFLRSRSVRGIAPAYKVERTSVPLRPIVAAPMETLYDSFLEREITGFP